MSLEPIYRRAFSEPDRAAVQEQVARAVESDPTTFLGRYARLEQSFGGRYVSADLFKETFAAYNASKEARNRYNAPVHNSAAVLAAEQLRHLLSRTDEPHRDTVILLTGIPGAGKTSSVLEAGELPGHFRAVYEGQLARRETAFARVQQVLDAGLKPVILMVHATPEQALANTLRRFEELGRGAGIDVMASIQAGLPLSLAAVREQFGNAVHLQIVDRRVFHEPQILEGWEHLGVLESEGDHEHIKQRLERALEPQYAAGRILEAAYRQARGLAPRSPDPGLDSPSRGRDESPRHEPRRAAQNRQEALLTEPSSSAALPAAVPSAAERLRARAEQVSERVTAQRAAERAIEPAHAPTPGPPEREHSKSHELDNGPGFDLDS